MTLEVLENPRSRPVDAERSRQMRLEMIVTMDIRPKVTYDELLKLCALNDVVNFEWDPDGTLHIISPAAAGSSRKNADITGQLGVWAKVNGSGIVFDSSGGFILPDGKMRNPDASWVRRERWAGLRKEQQENGFPPLMPDFVVVLRSPTNSRPELKDKMKLYISNGLRLGWLIDPFAEEVEIHRPGAPAEVLSKPLVLSGEDVLPGFVLDLKGILFD